MSMASSMHPDKRPGEAALERVSAVQRRVPLLQVVALLILFFYGAETLQGLAQWTSIESILVLAAPLGLAAAGQTFVILVGGFDLSVSGVIVASALMITTLQGTLHISLTVAIVIAVLGAGILGALVGMICHRFRIQPLIVTLAMGTIAVGLVQTQTNGLTAGGAPNWLSNLALPTGKTFGLPIPPYVSIWIVAAIALAIFLHRTPAGRRLLAAGANPAGAEFSLISTRRVWTLVFAFSAMASALVGILVAGADGSVSGTSGDPYLFGSVVAVIVGGTVLGGPGDYTRTVVGALFVTVLNVVLVGHGASQATQDIVYGAVILFAVSLYGRERRLRDEV
jgi:ribose transport system permease protein